MPLKRPATRGARAACAPPLSHALWFLLARLPCRHAAASPTPPPLRLPPPGSRTAHHPLPLHTRYSPPTHHYYLTPTRYHRRSVLGQAVPDLTFYLPPWDAPVTDALLHFLLPLPSPLPHTPPPHAYHTHTLPACHTCLHAAPPPAYAYAPCHHTPHTTPAYIPPRVHHTHLQWDQPTHTHTTHYTAAARACAAAHRALPACSALRVLAHCCHHCLLPTRACLSALTYARFLRRALPVHAHCGSHALPVTTTLRHRVPTYARLILPLRRRTHAGCTTSHTPVPALRAAPRSCLLPIRYAATVHFPRQHHYTLLATRFYLHGWTV